MKIIDNGEKDRDVTGACRLISQYLKNLSKYYSRKERENRKLKHVSPIVYPPPDSLDTNDEEITYDKNDLDEILGLKEKPQMVDDPDTMACSASAPLTAGYYTTQAMTAQATSQAMTAQQIQQYQQQAAQWQQQAAQATSQTGTYTQIFQGPIRLKKKKKETLDEILGL